MPPPAHHPAVPNAPLRPPAAARLVAARLVLVASALSGSLLAGCASGRGSAVPADNTVTADPVTRVAPTGGRGSLEFRTTNEDLTRSANVDASPDSVWAALAPVYSALKIPYGTFLSAERRLGTTGHRVRGSFAGMRLGRMVNCGQSASGGDNADLYEVFLDVTSVAAPGAGGTTALRTSVAGVARSATMAGEPVRCVTTGALEERIAQAVRARVGGR